MNLHVIATGSGGNCYILDTPRGKLLLDCGVRIRDIKEALGFDLTSVVGCLLTHEHKDHSKAAAELMVLGVDVYTSAGTARACKLEGHRLHIEQDGWMFDVGRGIKVMAIATQHDAAEPLGFVINVNGEQLLYATDTYYLSYIFKGLNYIIIECNYMLDTLDANIAAGRIPRELRRRLLKSHFELHNLVGFLQASDLKKCRQIILIHLSDGNSDARRMVSEVFLKTGIQCIAADAGMDIKLEMVPF